MHIPNVSPEIIQEISVAMKRPEGTVFFRYHFDGLFDPALGCGILLEILSGAIFFRLERDQKLNLHFIHSAPGTGTRVASVDLNPLKGSTAINIVLVWSSEETRLHVADSSDPKRKVVGDGILSDKQFRIGTDGKVYQIGDTNVKVMDTSIYKGTKPILQSTAIEAWNNTIEAIKILMTGKSSEGYIFEVICTNLIIVMLVTGFETHCKRRFLELDDEGIGADFDVLVTSFLSKPERDRGEQTAIIEEATTENKTPLLKLVEQGRIDFQNYDRCKTAFNKGYGIKFGEDLGVSNSILEDLQRIISFRHRIVHINPMLGMLNQGKVPPEEPIFPKRDYAEKALNVFDNFIQALHKSTLKLRPVE